MHQHQGAHLAPGDQGGSGDRLAKGCWSAEHANLVLEHFPYRNLLVLAQGANELDSHLPTRHPFILQFRADVILRQHLQQRIETSSRQADVPGVVLGATDDPWLVPDRQAHGLGFVKFRVLECGQPYQAIGQRLRHLDLGDENLVGQNETKRFRQGAGNRLTSGRLALPRLAVFLLHGEGHVQWMAATAGPQDGFLQIPLRQALHRHQKGPLIGMGLQLFIDEHAVPRFPGQFLQRQGNQVAKAALGHCVLIGKQAVVTCQRQLPGAVAGMADQRGSELPGLTGWNGLGKEYPGMRTVPRAGYLQRSRNGQLPAGLHEGAGILPPVSLVKINRQKKARVISEERVDANGLFSGEMIVEDLVGDRQELPLGAIAAFDPGLVADTRPPLVAAGRSIAGGAFRRLPAQGVDVLPSLEETTEKGDFFLGA